MSLPEPGLGAADAELVEVVRPDEVEVQTAQTPPLRKRMVRATAWTIVRFGVGNVLRLASNLALTRLLFPEAFGLMAVVNVVMQGLQMFSDVGIGPSVIQNARGDDADFLRTAWTIQAIRGVGLWICCCIIAAGLWVGTGVLKLSLSGVYGDPLLFKILAVVGLTALVSGLNSTRLFTAQRHLDLGRLVIMTTLAQVASLGLMVVWAWYFRSVWALAGGAIIQSVLIMAGSHLLLPGQKAGFGWNKEVAGELFRFGRWIFLSTMMGFLAAQGDRLALGGVMSPAELGVYSIAIMLAMMPVEVLRNLSSSVLFPAYTIIARGEEAGARRKILRVRIMLMLVVLPALAGLSVFGPTIIRILYDARYVDAGWMLRVLAAGFIPLAVITTLSPVLLAKGDSFRAMLVQLARVVILLTGMVVGGLWWGQTGVVGAVALAPTMTYPAVAWAVKRHGVLILWLDVAAIGAAGGLAAVGVALW